MSLLVLANNQDLADLEKDVVNICKPLFEDSIFSANQIKHFTYGRYYNDGSIYFLTTNRLLCQHHFNNKYNLVPYLDDSFIGKNIHFFPSINNQNEDYNQVIYDSQNYFQMFHPIFMIEKNKQYMDIYIIATKFDNGNVFNIYCNYMDVLIKFKSYFKSTASSLIKKISNNKIITPHEMQKNCHLINSVDSSDSKARLKEELSSSRLILSEKFNENYITKAEYEILNFFVKGYTVKEISNFLKISPKTIDAHLCKIKVRLNIRKKSELFEIAFDLGIF